MQVARTLDVSSAWPELPFRQWRDTLDTLHRWTQIVGKIQLALTPRINHWWNVALRVSARGLSTSIIPCGDRWFELEFDFIDDALHLRTSDGQSRGIALAGRTVAAFYEDLMDELRAADIQCEIWPMPVELFDEPIRLDRDEKHRSYDKSAVLRFWHALALTQAVLEQFRARFLGKSSPVHFFWGTFDLALTRFSGRPAPAPEGTIEHEAYSHEQMSVGWWPGDRRLERASFYAYAYPEPAGYGSAKLGVQGAYYHPALKGFYLDYDDVRTSPDPERRILDFCQASYALAADLGRWERAALERR